MWKRLCLVETGSYSYMNHFLLEVTCHDNHDSLITLHAWVEKEDTIRTISLYHSHSVTIQNNSLIILFQWELLTIECKWRYWRNHTVLSWRTPHSSKHQLSQHIQNMSAERTTPTLQSPSTVVLKDNHWCTEKHHSPHSPAYGVPSHKLNHLGFIISTEIDGFYKLWPLWASIGNYWNRFSVSPLNWKKWNTIQWS